MANWKEAINIAGIHRLCIKGDIGLQATAKAVVRKLQNTEAFAISDPELTDVMCAFNTIDEYARLKDYATALDLLYEYGDKNYRLWIEAEDVNPQEHDDIPTMKKSPFEEDTSPQFSKPHYHGPYLQPQNGSEWVKYPKPEPNPDLEGTPEEWDKEKMYRVGELVLWKGTRYKCIISCANVDPGPNSYNKPGDSWKYVRAEPAPILDHSLAFTDRITCSVPAKCRVYPLTRKHHYMSEYEFNKKLEAANITPATVPKDLYVYMKDCEEPYQEWLMDRWHKHNLTFRTPIAV